MRFLRMMHLIPGRTEYDMKAASIEHSGPPESIRYGELPTSVVGEHDVLVKVAAVTVDSIDTCICSGAYKTPLPGRLSSAAIEPVW